MRRLRKPERYALWIAAILFVAIIFFYTSKDFWIRQGQAYFVGTMVMEAGETGPDLPEVDEVEVMLLGGLKHPDQSFMEGRLSDYKITGRAVLQGEDAKKVTELWRLIPRNTDYMAACFQPLFALRFKEHNALLLETTVCWGCQIYTLPFGPFGRWGYIMEYGFDARCKPAQDLLKLLRKRVPAPASSAPNSHLQFPPRTFDRISA